jgi:hypothetical protein
MVPALASVAATAWSVRRPLPFLVLFGERALVPG